ncbi:PLDc_N domain-containing protein [Streptomyces sp. NP160]|uniref:PLD nuclease N-terminal domain-containing protein n=1 Tax=Streptomyces sp. NP160 TaxID=2586637 RepID=UPI00111875E7|nr:PLD nuclease N-terminal domain-containing protein [Streptomyces sp. NP160]TNM70035.1 PLDc_N domain-containing protein [Streptomyces sp. NP160]
MLVALVALVLGIYALVDCLRTTGSQVRGLPVGVWVAVIVLLPVVGPLAWLLAGRTHGPRPAPPVSTSRGGAPKGPDDDEDFLRSLDRKHRGDV